MVSVARKSAGYDEDHMERLQYNSTVFSRAMQLSPKYEDLVSDSFVETISIAAPLQDLGNVAIPSEILTKTERLTPEEVELIHTHTTVGADILKDVLADDYNDFIQMSMEIAHYHHENWDGSGYPCGLKGDAIPLAAQVVALMGAFCALTESRGYRSSYSREDTLEILDLESGVKFNPELVDICKKISRQLH